MGEHDFMKGVDYNNLSPELINQTMVKPRTESSKPTYEAEKPHETYKPRTFVDHAKQIQSAKPISSDEEESEFSPVESQRPSYELPERRQKSKLLYHEPSEREEKTKNKPLLKEETPDWEKLKQKDEKSPDPKQNIQIGKGRGTDKIPEKDLNLIKRQGDVFPEDDKPMQLKPFDSVKPSTKDETKYMPYSTEKKGSEIEKRTPKNAETHEKPDSAKPISPDEEESEFSPVESQHPSYELPERRQKSKLLHYEPSEQEEKRKNKPSLKEESPDWEKLKQKDEKSPDPKQNIQIGKGRGSDKTPEKDLNLIKRQGDVFPEDDKPMQLKPFDSVKPSTKDETKYMPYSTEKKGSEIEKRTPKNAETHEKPDSAKPISPDE